MKVQVERQKVEKEKKKKTFTKLVMKTYPYVILTMGENAGNSRVDEG